MLGCRQMLGAWGNTAKGVRVRQMSDTWKRVTPGKEWHLEKSVSKGKKTMQREKKKYLAGDVERGADNEQWKFDFAFEHEGKVELGSGDFGMYRSFNQLFFCHDDSVHSGTLAPSLHLHLRSCVCACYAPCSRSPIIVSKVVLFTSFALLTLFFKHHTCRMPPLWSPLSVPLLMCVFFLFFCFPFAHSHFRVSHLPVLLPTLHCHPTRCINAPAILRLSTPNL